MDEPAIAEIDAHMGDAATVDAKEDQIPGLETPAGDRFRGIVLGPGSAGHVDTGLTVGVLHQAAAVEAFPRRAATVAIGRAEQIHGGGQDAFPFDCRRIGLAHGCAAASGQQVNGKQDSGNEMRRARHAFCLAQVPPGCKWFWRLLQHEGFVFQPCQLP